MEPIFENYFISWHLVKKQKVEMALTCEKTIIKHALVDLPPYF